MKRLIKGINTKVLLLVLLLVGTALVFANLQTIQDIRQRANVDVGGSGGGKEPPYRRMLPQDLKNKPKDLKPPASGGTQGGGQTGGSGNSGTQGGNQGQTGGGAQSGGGQTPAGGKGDAPAGGGQNAGEDPQGSGSTTSTTATACFTSTVGNPKDQAKPPAECETDSGSSGAAVWPLPEKKPSQYRRIDQGWDLVYHKQTGVRAIAAGKVSIAGNNPGGFGPDYPLLTLDTPICGFKAIYYGHVHVDKNALGKHVNAGDIIAQTDPNGINSEPNWVEPGFWGGSGPAAAGGNYPSKEGKIMKNWILNGKCDDNIKTEPSDFLGSKN